MSQGGPNSSSGSGANPIESLTGNSGGAVGPDGAMNIDVLGNNATGIDVVGTPGSNLLTLLGLPSTETQVGTVELATAVETGTLTDTLRAITPSSLEPILVTPFMVAPGGAYTTIQSAIDAAVAAGGISQTVMVRPGSFTEDLDFSGCTVFTVGLTMVGAVALGDEGQCEIIGTHTPPASGTLILRNFRLSDATAIFSSAAVGTARLVVIDAEFNVTNGHSFDLVNWNGIFEFFDTNPGTGEDGFINNTGGSTLFLFSAGIGAGTTQTMTLSGTTDIGEGNINCPVNFGTGSAIAIDVCQFTQTVTFSGNSTGDLNMCRFSGGASSSITMSSSASISIANSIVDSANNPSIAGAGAGTLTLTQTSFEDNAALAATLTLGSSSVYPVNMTNGELLIGSTGQPSVAATLTAGTNITVTNAAGSITIDAAGGILAITSLTNADTPYTVLAADEYLSCDVSGGVLTIDLADAPTTGRIVVIKDSGGDAGTNNITVTTTGGAVTLDGSTTFVMNTNFEAANFIFNGASYEVF